MFTQAAATGSAGGTTALSASGTKTIKVRFEVLNGGLGLWFSEGIVSTQDDSYPVYDKASCASDFTIAVTVPASDEYLNIRRLGTACFDAGTFVKAKMKAESGTITLDYDGKGKIAANNLYDVQARCPL